MREETKNLYMAVILSILIIFGVNHFFGIKGEMPQQKVKVQEVIPDVEKEQVKEISETLSVDEALKHNERVKIENSAVNGSIRLKGARFDFLNLKKYKETLEENSPNVQILMPAETKAPYFAEFGFLAQNPNMVPNASSVWISDGAKLTPETPVTLKFDNGSGLIFTRKISVDENEPRRLTYNNLKEKQYYYM